MRLGSSFLFAAVLFPCLAQAPRVPDVERQRASMKKLAFLVGKWSGDARIQRGPNEALELAQTEDAQYKLDGLILLIEGTGRNKSDGKVVFRALATVSYDDGTGAYRMRAYNDGRYLETELKLAGNGKGFTWGFVFGQIRTDYVMTINEKDEWTEVGEVTMGAQPPRKFVELTVRLEK
ncbi:MAG TPA: hypothetical protein VEU62_18290 [Bryobacterales bacterium]|nr:hypothetical protein [Bryobacterales bacterium]